MKEHYHIIPFEKETRLLLSQILGTKNKYFELIKELSSCLKTGMEQKEECDPLTCVQNGKRAKNKKNFSRKRDKYTAKGREWHEKTPPPFRVPFVSLTEIGDAIYKGASDPSRFLVKIWRSE